MCRCVSCRQYRAVVVLIAVGFAILLTTASPVMPEDNFSKPQELLGGSELCGPYEIVTTDDGLVYLIWNSDSRTCDFTVWAPSGSTKITDWSYCKNLHLLAVTSGHEKWGSSVQLDLDHTVPGEYFFPTRGRSGRPDEGAVAWEDDESHDILHFAWSGVDSCGAFDSTKFVTNRGRQIRYAEIKVGKTVPGDITITGTDSVSLIPTVNDTIQRKVKGPRVVSDNNTLHFGWTDSRCDIRPDQLEDPYRHFGVTMYSKRVGDSWLQREYYCDDSTRPWTDHANLLEYQLHQNCDCCPRGLSLPDGCDASDCVWGQSQIRDMFADDDGNLHFFIHSSLDWATHKETEACEDSSLSNGPDNLLYEQITSAGEWKALDFISTGDSWSFGADACITTDGYMVVFYDDSYDGICGIYYRVKAPDQDAFAEDASLVFQDRDPCPWPVRPTVRMDARVVSARDDIHLVVAGRSKVVVCDPQFPVDTRVLDIWYRKGTYEDSTIAWDDGVGVTDTTDNISNRNPSIISDACGNIHIFYTTSSTPVCTSGDGLELHHVVIENSESTCDVLYPDGGEEWLVGSTHAIRWKLCPRTDGKVTSQSVYVSRDAGTSWNSVATGLDPLARAYDWQVSSRMSENCKIKIVAEMDTLNAGDTWDTGIPCAGSSESTFVISCGVEPGTPSVDADLSNVDSNLDTLFVCTCGNELTLVVTDSLVDTSGIEMDSLCTRLTVVLSPADDDDDLYVCGGATLIHEGMTDNEGQISLSVSGLGGCGDIDVAASVFGIEMTDTARIVINSPDINGDSLVNLVDFGLFSSMLHTNAWCGNFDYPADTIVTLIDLGRLTDHYLEEACPNPPPGGQSPSILTQSGTLLASIIGAEPANDGLESHEFRVTGDGFRPSDYSAIELLLSYRPEDVEPVAWDGCGEHYFIRMEESTFGEETLSVARIVARIGEACGPAGSSLGALKFRQLRGHTGASPSILKVLALAKDGGIEDVSSHFDVGSHSLEIGDRRLALRPVLELAPNPSGWLTEVRFGIPLDMGHAIGLSVYDVRGRLISEIYDGPNDGFIQTGHVGKGQGGTSLPAPGIYFVRLTADGRLLLTEKLVLLR